MRVVIGCWLAVALVSAAACLQQQGESFPLLVPPPPDGGDSTSSGTSSASSGGPNDAGATDACSPSVTVCAPVPDAGPDQSCPPSGTVTGTVVSKMSGCTTDLLSQGGVVTEVGCCSTACLPGGCQP